MAVIEEKSMQLDLVIKETVENELHPDSVNRKHSCSLNSSEKCDIWNNRALVKDKLEPGSPLAMALKSVVSSLFSTALKKGSLLFFWALQKCSHVLILLSYINALLRGHSSLWHVQFKSSLLIGHCYHPCMTNSFLPPSIQGVPEFKVSTSGFNSRADAESETSIHMSPFRNGSGVTSF